MQYFPKWCLKYIHTVANQLFLSKKIFFSEFFFQLFSRILWHFLQWYFEEYLLILAQKIQICLKILAVLKLNLWTKIRILEHCDMSKSLIFEWFSNFASTNLKILWLIEIMSQTDHQVNQRSSQPIFFFVFYTFAQRAMAISRMSNQLLDSLCSTEMNKKENEGGVDTRQNLLLKIITSH